jgi:hypothetical protein
MNDRGRRSGLFRRRRRQRSSPMRYGIAVVALPRLDELSVAAARRGGVALSRAYRSKREGVCLDAGRGRLSALKAPGRVSMGSPG